MKERMMIEQIKKAMNECKQLQSMYVIIYISGAGKYPEKMNDMMN